MRQRAHYLFVVPVLTIAMLLAGCDHGCANAEASTIATPDGRLRAVVFSRDCGATTGFSTHVSVVPGRERLPNDGGNVLVLDGQVKLEVSWLADNKLRIKGVNSARVFRQQASVLGVEVSYE